MGKWMNVAFVQTGDLGRLEAAVERLLEEAGRHQVRPPPRTPEPYDPMQYGHGEDVPRWGLAGFLALPGWCALRSAPYELLMEGEAPFLARLTEQLGTVGFQYNLYDSTGEFLFEADAQGGIEQSGLGGSHNWQRLWRGAEPSMERLEVCFRRVDPGPAARLARERRPELWVSEIASSGPEEEALRAWLAAVGGETFTHQYPGGSLTRWRAHAAHVVLAMVGGQDASFLSGDVKAEAVRLVFGGEAAEYCDNGFLVETLIPHAPLPLSPAFVLYGDRDPPSRSRRR